MASVRTLKKRQKQRVHILSVWLYLGLFLSILVMVHTSLLWDGNASRRGARENHFLFFVRCRIALILAEIIYSFCPQLEAFIAPQGYGRTGGYGLLLMGCGVI